MSKKDKRTPVKAAVIQIIYDATLPIYHRLCALTEDVVSGAFHLAESEKSLLLEHTAYAISLKFVFEDILEEVSSKNLEVVYLESNEFKNILYMSKTIEKSSRIVFNNTGIWSH